MFAAAIHSDIRPENEDEAVVWHCVVWTYGYYLLGALYLLAPVVGWTVVTRMAKRNGLAGTPMTVWVWMLGMLMMEVSLIAAHADQGLDVGSMIKGSIGWAKGWALIALFIIVGQGRIRLELLARASNIVGYQTLILLPLLAMTYLIGLPGKLYVSPISAVGGPGPEFFSVELYGTGEGTSLPRWRLFAPWAPGMGMVMGIHLVLSLNDPDRKRILLGQAGMLLAIFASASRLGLMAYPLVLGIAWMLANLNQAYFWLGASPIALLAGIFSEPINDLREELLHKFHGARADSSRVRAMLGRMAVDRWYRDGYTWGHGTVQPGPHIVEHMPIGSHHTWYGTLFVKGLVGAIGLAIPFLWSLFHLMIGARNNAARRTGLRVLVLLFLYTFAENLEILSYLYWPGLVALGIAFKPLSELQAYDDDRLKTAPAASPEAPTPSETSAEPAPASAAASSPEVFSSSNGRSEAIHPS